MAFVHPRSAIGVLTELVQAEPGGALTRLAAMATRRLELGFDGGTVLRLTVEEAVSERADDGPRRRQRAGLALDRGRGGHLLDRQSELLYVRLAPGEPPAASASAAPEHLGGGLTVDLGLVGRANAGKTALFALVTGADAEIAPYPFTTREPARAMADVPDPRLDAIADAQDIPRRVPAQVQLVDIAGLAAGRRLRARGSAARPWASCARPTPWCTSCAPSPTPRCRTPRTASTPSPTPRPSTSSWRSPTATRSSAGSSGCARAPARARRARRPSSAALEGLAAALDAGRPARLADGRARPAPSAPRWAS